MLKDNYLMLVTYALQEMEHKFDVLYDSGTKSANIFFLERSE
jgi:hypothetical protein